MDKVVEMGDQPQAVAVSLPGKLGLRMASNDSYVNLYVNGKYAGDMRLEEENGMPVLVLFTGGEYHRIDLKPGAYEWDRRHPDFDRYEFLW